MIVRVSVVLRRTVVGVYVTLILIVQRLRYDFMIEFSFYMTILPSLSNTTFGVSGNERDQSSAKEEEASDTHTEERDGVSVEDGGVQTDQPNQEHVEEEHKVKEKKENDEDEEVQRQEETEEHVNKNDNEDAHDDGKEDAVNEEAVFGAFLQVSEPALVSSHHDGFLRFWNFSVSL